MTIELGGNITLTGFANRDFTELIVVKKMVGQYARKMADSHDLNSLKITLKEVHGTKHDIHVHAVAKGQDLFSEMTAENLYIALDACLKKVLTQAEKI